MKRTTILVVLPMALSIACSGAKEAADTGTGTAAAQAYPGEGTPWADKNKKERAVYMKKVVVPKIGPLLTAFDPERFPKVECTTCHGAGAKEGKFDMPNAELETLVMANMFEKHRTDEPKITKFMMGTVVPTMAELLETTPFNMETNTGLGCMTCHNIDMGSKPAEAPADAPADEAAPAQGGSEGSTEG